MPEKSKRPPLPRFKTEAEEAQWWFDNRTMVEKEFMAAMKNGTVGRGIAQRLAHEARESKNITIRMPVADISPARPRTAPGILPGRRGSGTRLA